MLIVRTTWEVSYCEPSCPNMLGDRADLSVSEEALLSRAETKLQHGTRRSLRIKPEHLYEERKADSAVLGFLGVSTRRPSHTGSDASLLGGSSPFLLCDLEQVNWPLSSLFSSSVAPPSQGYVRI